MTKEKFVALFDLHNDNLSTRKSFKTLDDPPAKYKPDLSAFIILNTLSPKTTSSIACADHDIIYLNPSIDKLLTVITEDIIIRLIKCGVVYDSYSDSLVMYV
jgi:hypothetical protein